MKYLTYIAMCISLAFAAFLGSCGNGTNDANQDSLALISDTFLTDAEQAANNSSSSMFDAAPAETKPQKPTRNARPQTNYAANYGAANPSANEKVYQAPARSGEQPEDFAQALIVPAVRLCFPDPFSEAEGGVLKADETENGWKIKVRISWRDKWSKNPYTIEGTLEVDKNGKNALFNIEQKNAAAQALEVTTGKSKTQVKIASL